MALLGSLNWWAPAPLRRLYERIGLHEEPRAPGQTPRTKNSTSRAGDASPGQPSDHRPIRQAT